jgi:hypothetical protein
MLIFALFYYDEFCIFYCYAECCVFNAMMSVGFLCSMMSFVFFIVMLSVAMMNVVMMCIMAPAVIDGTAHLRAALYHIMILVYFTVGSTTSGSAFGIAPNLGAKLSSSRSHFEDDSSPYIS